MTKNYYVQETVRNLILFCCYGLLYYGIETVWKYPRTSHWSMFIVGGIIGVVIGGINNYLDWEMPFWQQCAVGAVWTTLVEGIAGIILNIWLKLGVWDYSRMPFRFFFGQCCLPFCVAWFVLSGVAIILDDYLRFLLFGEEKPHYSLT